MLKGTRTIFSFIPLLTFCPCQLLGFLYLSFCQKPEYFSFSASSYPLQELLIFPESDFTRALRFAVELLIRLSDFSYTSSVGDWAFFTDHHSTSSIGSGIRHLIVTQSEEIAFYTAAPRPVPTSFKPCRASLVARARKSAIPRRIEPNWYFSTPPPIKPGGTRHRPLGVVSLIK